jgi:hypothetical protein
MEAAREDLNHPEQRGRVSYLRFVRSLLEREGLLFTHSSDDRDKEFLSVVECDLNLFSKVTFRHLHVVLGVPVVGHQIEKTVINIHELIFGSSDIGDIHVVGRGTDIFELLASENL